LHLQGHFSETVVLSCNFAVHQHVSELVHTNRWICYTWYIFWAAHNSFRTHLFCLGSYSLTTMVTPSPRQNFLLWVSLYSLGVWRPGLRHYQQRSHGMISKVRNYSGRSRCKIIQA